MNLPLDQKVEGEDEWLEKWSILGCKTDVMYYRFYSHFTGPDIRIVPEDICRFILESSLNPKQYRYFYMDKNSWGLLYPDKLFPPTILRCMDGFFYTAHYERLSGRGIVARALAEAEGERFIVKPTRDSGSGKNFHTLKEKNGSILVDGGKTVIREDEEMIRLVDKDFIIQPFMKQHPDLARFCSSSVNPIRITTYRSVTDDKIHVLSGGVLRIGCQGEENDGTHGNGRFVGIRDDGELKHAALHYKGDAKDTFNGIDFKNGHFMIPNFEGVKQTAIEAASKVPHARLLAFDIMVDENGKPVAFEYNLDSYSIWLAQLTGEVAFGEYTDEIIDYSVREFAREKQVFLY